MNFRARVNIEANALPEPPRGVLCPPINYRMADFHSGVQFGTSEFIRMMRDYESACSQLARPHVRNLIDYLEKEMKK